MTNNDYINFYEECLKGNFTIKKYLPVKDYIIKIFKHYEARGSFNKRVFIEGYNEHNLLNFVKNILKTFRCLMENNAFDNIDEYIDFLLDLDVIFSFFSQALKALLLKDKYIYTKKKTDNYYYSIESLCSSCFIDKINNYDSNLRAINMFKIYAYYYQDPQDENITDEESLIRKYYKKIGPSVIAAFYLSDYDLERLDNALYNLRYNCFEVRDYLSLNGLYRYYNEEECDNMGKVILEKSIGNKIIIK